MWRCETAIALRLNNMGRAEAVRNMSHFPYPQITMRYIAIAPYLLNRGEIRQNLTGYY